MLLTLHMSTGEVCTYIIGFLYLFHGSHMHSLSRLATKVRGRRGRYVFHLSTTSDRTTTTKHESKSAQVPSSTQQARRLFLAANESLRSTLSRRLHGYMHT